MIILDTNVLSELTRKQPSQSVTTWLYKVASDSIYTTSVTRAEILFGLKLMPDGRRNDDLTTRSEFLFEQLLERRVLPFDHDAAVHFAEVALARRRAGRPINTADAMIAAIAIARGFDVATRNVRDFEETGASVVNPFE